MNGPTFLGMKFKRGKRKKRSWNRAFNYTQFIEWNAFIFCVWVKGLDFPPDVAFTLPLPLPRHQILQVLTKPKNLITSRHHSGERGLSGSGESALMIHVLYKTHNCPTTLAFSSSPPNIKNLPVSEDFPPQVWVFWRHCWGLTWAPRGHWNGDKIPTRASPSALDSARKKNTVPSMRESWRQLAWSHNS